MFDEIQMDATGIVVVLKESLTGKVSKMPMGQQCNSCFFAQKAMKSRETKL